MSQEIIGLKPPPKHQPLTIAMVGFGKALSRCICQICAWRAIWPHSSGDFTSEFAEELLEVHARRESIACAGEHQHAAALVELQRFEHLNHLFVERPGSSRCAFPAD